MGWVDLAQQRNASMRTLWWLYTIVRDKERGQVIDYHRICLSSWWFPAPRCVDFRLLPIDVYVYNGNYYTITITSFQPSLLLLLLSYLNMENKCKRRKGHSCAPLTGWPSDKWPKHHSQWDIPISHAWVRHGHVGKLVKHIVRNHVWPVDALDDDNRKKQSEQVAMPFVPVKNILVGACILVVVRGVVVV